MQAEQKEFVYIFIKNNESETSSVTLSGRFEAGNVTKDHDVYVINTPLRNIHVSRNFVYKHEYEISDNDYDNGHDPLKPTEFGGFRVPSVTEIAIKN